MSGHADEAAWLEWRRGGIGASDSPAILGVCPHRTRLAVYLDKIGASAPRPRTETQEFGLRLEPLIAAVYSERTDVEIVARQEYAQSPDYPWMRASLDGRGHDGRIVEFKALGVYQANEFKAAAGDWRSLPDSWIVQGNHQMIVAEVDAVDFAVFYPLELRLYTLPRSEYLCRRIVDWTRRFWDLVESRTPPKTVDARDAERIHLAYPKAHGTVRLSHPTADAAAERLRADPRNKDAYAQLASLMGEAEAALLDNGLIARRKLKYRAGYTVAPSTSCTLEIETAEEESR